jgi:flagellar motility protein MotE (MotC chaperone)
MDRVSFAHILPVVMVAAAIAFGVRFSDIVVTQGPTPAQLSAIEPSAGDAAKPDVSTDAPPMPEQALTTTAETPAETEGKPEVDVPSLGAPPAADWKGADDLDDEYSEVKMELFNDLTKRRKDLDAREKELNMREALLKAGQAEIEQKYKELTTIKADIEELLKKQNDEENKRIASLVKIYEGMKAKDAARIFDTLDMDVLLQVMTKMSERKSAPILASMDAEKARNVTIMMAEQNKLPSLPNLGDAATP